jgi:membrane-associated phospholipid phosphatase
MPAAAHAARRRILPNGYRDLLLQLTIWFGFLYAYRLTRGVADRNPYAAFDNGLKVVGVERGFTGLWELSLQSLLNSSSFLEMLASWTYWQSQFTFLGLALLWVYLRRHESFARWRNTIMLANLIGLVGYVLMPTAPPRMFPELGYVDTLNDFSISHSSGLINWGSNPYAAMPSLHAADSLLIALMLMSVVRTRWAKPLFLLWPAWVWFSVMATGNHFWLDILAGVAVAVFALAIVNWRLLHRARERWTAKPPPAHA